MKIIEGKWSKDESNPEDKRDCTYMVIEDNGEMLELFTTRSEAEGYITSHQSN